jgi:hypothetical protein
MRRAILRTMLHLENLPSTMWFVKMERRPCLFLSKMLHYLRVMLSPTFQRCADRWCLVVRQQNTCLRFLALLRTRLASLLSLHFVKIPKPNCRCFLKISRLKESQAGNMVLYRSKTALLASSLLRKTRWLRRHMRFLRMRQRWQYHSIYMSSRTSPQQ